MIVVLGLSPAVDVTYQLEKLEIGKTNRVERVLQKPGGKSLNVTNVSKQLGGNPHLVVPLGGVRGSWISSQLTKAGVSFTQVPIALETRQALTVYDGVATVINEAATSIGAGELKEIKTSVLSAFDAAIAKPVAGEDSLFVVSGSIPAGVPLDFLNHLIHEAHARGIRSVIDVSGPALLAIASAHPYLIKPNNDEIIEATGAANVRDAVAQLHSMGAQNILVSLGADGAVWYDENGSRFGGKAIPGVTGNPTGAGDAMVAAVCVGLSRGNTKPEILLDALSAGAAAVMAPMAGEIDLANFETLRKKAELN